MKTIRLTESDFKKLISESINQILITEAFKSNLLRNFFQEHKKKHIKQLFHNIKHFGTFVM